MRGRNEPGDRSGLARRAEWRADAHPPVAVADNGSVGGGFSLPPEIAGQSLVPARTVLPFDAALQAIARAAEAGVRLESWEGWVKMHDGSRVRSLEHGGSFALPRDAAKSAQVAARAIKHAQARFDRDPEYPDSQLYFGLTFDEAVTGKR